MRQRNRSGRRLALAARAALAALIAAGAHAQSADSYPAKPVTLVVTWPAGGFADLLGCEMAITYAVWGPSGLRPEVLSTLAKALRQVVGSAAFRDKLADEGAEPLAVLTQPDSLAFFNQERARLTKIARDNAIKAE